MEYKASFKPQCQDTCVDRDRSVDCDDLRSVISLLLDQLLSDLNILFLDTTFNGAFPLEKNGLPASQKTGLL